MRAYTSHPYLFFSGDTEVSIYNGVWGVWGGRLVLGRMSFWSFNQPRGKVKLRCGMSEATKDTRSNDRTLDLPQTDSHLSLDQISRLSPHLSPLCCPSLPLSFLLSPRRHHLVPPPTNVYCLLLRKGTKFISRYTQFDDAIGPQEKLCGWWTTSHTHSLHTPFSVVWFGFVMQCVQMQMVLWCNAQRREIYAACEQIYTPFSVVWFGDAMRTDAQMHKFGDAMRRQEKFMRLVNKVTHTSTPHPSDCGFI